MTPGRRLLVWATFIGNLLGLALWYVYVWPDFRGEVRRVLG